MDGQELRQPFAERQEPGVFESSLMEIQIGERMLGPGHPSFIVAELSANHNQDLSIALATIDAAAAAGADAVKLQTYTPDTITFPSDNEVFRVRSGSVWDGRTLYDLYAEAYTPWEWHSELFEHARGIGLECFSSPFDPTALDLLESLGSPAYKVASFEITDTPLIRAMAAQGKPIVISTGIATLSDIEEALAVCRSVGNEQVILLQCTSAYPADPRDANLRRMVDMGGRFGVPFGLSDHTTTPVAATAATALGACFIEKHLILDRSMGGPDSGFSLEPGEFADLVRLVRETEEVLGSASYELSEGTQRSRQFARSLFVVEDVAAGEEVTAGNVRSIRPGDGLPPGVFDDLAGQQFAEPVKAGTPLGWSMLRSATGSRESE